jgi:hypothetical protein
VTGEKILVRLVLCSESPILTPDMTCAESDMLVTFVPKPPNDGVLDVSPEKRGPLLGEFGTTRALDKVLKPVPGKLNGGCENFRMLVWSAEGDSGAGDPSFCGCRGSRFSLRDFTSEAGRGIWCGNKVKG